MFILEKYAFNYDKYEVVLRGYKEYSKNNGDYYDYEYLVYLIPHCERYKSKRGITKITGKDYEVVQRAIMWFDKMTQKK